MPHLGCVQSAYDEVNALRTKLYEPSPHYGNDFELAFFTGMRTPELLALRGRMSTGSGPRSGSCGVGRQGLQGDMQSRSTGELGKQIIYTSLHPRRHQRPMWILQYQLIRTWVVLPQ